jgi:hypothetical protein
MPLIYLPWKHVSIFQGLFDSTGYSERLKLPSVTNNSFATVAPRLGHFYASTTDLYSLNYNFQAKEYLAVSQSQLSQVFALG